MQITIPETTITIANPRYLKWALLLALLALALTLTGGGQPGPAEANNATVDFRSLAQRLCR